MSLVDEIKSRVRMKDVLEMYGYQPARGNNIYRCMYHADNHPSAHIGGDGDYFYCFSCHTHKDVIQFVCDQEKCDNRTAMRIIDSKFRLGIMKHLDEKEQWLVDAQAKLRNGRREREGKWKRIENEVLRQIADKLRFLEKKQEECHPTRREYRTGEWEKENCYFSATKEIERLEWLYDTLCDMDTEECEYTYLYGTNKRSLLSKIHKGNILIWEDIYEKDN